MMDEPEPPSSAVRCSLKRKLEQDEPTIGCEVLVQPRKSPQDLFNEAVSQVTILNSSLSDRVAAKHAVVALKCVVMSLIELADNDVITNIIVNCRVVSALSKHLKALELVKPYEYDVEKECVKVLGLLAINKPGHHQQLVADAGALPCLTDLLKRHKTFANSQALIKRLVIAIGRLVHQNNSIKNRVRMEGGIPPLVELLEFDDSWVQGAAAEALGCLTYDNDENRDEVVRCNAMPPLVLMLGSVEREIQNAAVLVIGNLVKRSTSKVRREVLLSGALQPVIGLLRSCCGETKRRAALIICELAMIDSDCKVHIAQRGAIQPLIDMLKYPNVDCQRISALALSTLANEDTHNQASIGYNGAIEPLLNVLCSENGPIQRHATFALYDLANNEDNVVDIVKAGGVQKLQAVDFLIQPAKEYVGKTLKRLEQKMHGRVLKQLLYLVRFGEWAVQRHMAVALAHLCSSDERKFIFVDNKGLDFLLDLLQESANLKQRREASMALHSLVVRTTCVSAPSSQTPKVRLDEQYVNNPALSDVTFLVEGKRFYAHRSCLLSSSDVFRAMVGGDYQESEAHDILIPNIKWDVFELMMTFIYTGTVDVNFDTVHDLLKAAEQYFLDGLKKLCERAIIQDVSAENVSLMYELSESFNAVSLRQACILFLLEQFDKVSVEPWYSCLMGRIVPDIRQFFHKFAYQACTSKISIFFF